uniref:SH3 and multiple ankyrin repeat domains 1 n=1 Tax=Periophthalmus magnuspinnatus TaxID=409849 RepID=A0A3B3ZLR8_9GOBI
EGFGFVLRGAKAQTPIEEFTPTPAFPALQYLESVDEGGVAWRAGLRMGDFLIEVNGQNVVKVGHRQVVNMIRQGGNSLMVKVVMVARNPELEDTTRKRAPQQTKRLTPPAIALRSKSMTSELEEMGKTTKETLRVGGGAHLHRYFGILFVVIIVLTVSMSSGAMEEERGFLHPPTMKLSRSLSVPGPEEIPPPPNTSAPEPPLSAGPYTGRGPAMPIPPVSQPHYQHHPQAGHPTQAGWDRGGPGGMVPTLRRQSEGLVREQEPPKRGGGKMGGLRRGYSSATPPTSAKPKPQPVPQHPQMGSREQPAAAGRGGARRGGRGALMKQSKVEDGVRQHRPKGGAPKEKSSIPIPTIIVKAPSTSSSGRSSQGSSMEAEQSQDAEDPPSPSMDNTADSLGSGRGDMRRKSASFFLSIQPLHGSQMDVPMPRLRPSKSIDEGMFSGDNYVNYSSSMPPAFGLPEYSSPILSHDGQPKSAPSMYGHQHTTTFIHPLTGKVLDPSSPLGLALAARERALKDDRRTRRDDRYFGRQMSTVGSFTTPIQTPTPSLFATPTQSTYTSPVSMHLTSPTATTSPASLSRPQSPRILRLGGGERVEREKEGGPREGLRVRFSEDRTSQYSPQYYPTPKEKEVYNNRPVSIVQPPPPPSQPAPCRPSFLQFDSSHTSYIPQYTVPSAPSHDSASRGVAGQSQEGLGLMVLPPPAPSIDAEDEFVFADPLPPPLQFANGKHERGIPHHGQNITGVPHPPPPAKNTSQTTSQGDSATSSLTSYDSEVANLTQSALSPSYPSPHIFPPTTTAPTSSDAVVDSGIEELDSHSSSDHHLEMLGLSGLRGDRGGAVGETEKVSENQDLCTAYSGGQTFDVLNAKLANPAFPKMTHYKEGGGRGPSVALRRQNTCLERPMDTRQVSWVDLEAHEQGRIQRGAMAMDSRRLHSPLSGVKANIINELSSKLQQMSGMKSMDDWSQSPKSPTMNRFVWHYIKQTFDFQCSPTKEMRSSVSRRRAPSPLIYNTEQQNPASTPPLYSPSGMQSPNPLLVSPKPFAVKPLPYWTKYDVADWLTYLNLGEHRERFIDNEIDGSHLPSLTKDDFLDLGVTRVGHRMNIERALKKLTDR